MVSILFDSWLSPLVSLAFPMLGFWGTLAGLGLGLLGSRSKGKESGRQRQHEKDLQSQQIESTDRSRREGYAHQTSEREGTQGWQSQERIGGQDWRSGEREGTQGWQTGEREGTQGWQTGEREGTQDWRSGEAGLDRSHALDMQSRMLNHYGSQQGTDRAWRSGENALDRGHDFDVLDHRAGLNDSAMENRLGVLGRLGLVPEGGFGDMPGVKDFDPNQLSMVKDIERGWLPGVRDVEFGGMPDRIGGLQLPGEADDREAEQAVFGRAAERQADLTQGSLRGLSQGLAERGFTEAGAGGAESALAGNIQQQGQGALSDLVREQAVQQLGRRQQVADRNLNAQLAARGQDVSQRGQDFTGRGQDITGELGLRGQDIGLRGQELSGMLQERGQDLGLRGQDIQSLLGLRGQDIGLRGQEGNRRNSLAGLALAGGGFY